jgi:hypothetical protein
MPTETTTAPKAEPSYADIMRDFKGYGVTDAEFESLTDTIARDLQDRVGFREVWKAMRDEDRQEMKRIWRETMELAILGSRRFPAIAQ